MAYLPAKAPVAVINRLNREVVRVLENKDIREKLMVVGLEPIGSTPEVLGIAIKSEMTRLGKVIKDAGIRAD